MTARATIDKTAGGPVLTVPKVEVADLGLMDGSTLTLAFEGENVVLRPVRQRQETLEDLVAQ